MTEVEYLIVSETFTTPISGLKWLPHVAVC